MVRRLLLTALLVIMVIGLLAGCGGKEEEAEQKWGFLPVEKVEIKVNEEFTIAKGFDMNSGFIWREKYDESMFELLENIIDSETREDGTIVLIHVFRFQAKKKGNTQIFLAHTRSTLDGPIIGEQVVYDVYIK
jgi:predicted secreted protein